MYEYPSFTELTEACAEFHDKFASKPTAETLETRRQLAGWVRKFHSECGTLTPQVEQALENLSADNCVLLMTAHQPNLFAYGGVLRKATLMHVLAQALAKRLAAPVVSFFGFADQDFADDRWVKSAQLPDVERRNGTLELRIQLPERIMLNKIPKPSDIILDKWKQELRDWVHRKVRMISELAGIRLDEHEYLEKLEQLWAIVTDSQAKAMNYADFNAFTISQSINSASEYDTLFCRFSECQQALRQEIRCLIDRFWEFSAAVREAEQRLGEETGGVPSGEHLTIPVWYHCECGSKARLMVISKEQPVVGRGECLNCHNQFEIQFSSTSGVWTELTKLSARALAMPILFLKGLGVSCYVGGVGGKQYLLQAEHAANRIGIGFPPLVVWRPRDRYLGLGQVDALLTFRKVTEALNVRQPGTAEAILRERLAQAQRLVDELETRKKPISSSLANAGERASEVRALAQQQDKIRRENETAMLSRYVGLLENSERIAALHPCLIDYAVNLGLRNVSEQWERALKSEGGLTSDIILRGPMDEVLQLCVRSSEQRLTESL